VSDNTNGRLLPNHRRFLSTVSLRLRDSSQGYRASGNPQGHPGLFVIRKSANWAKSDMLELPTGLRKLAKWLPRAIRELTWPVILIGVLYLLLPDQLLRSLRTEAAKYRLSRLALWQLRCFLTKGQNQDFAGYKESPSPRPLSVLALTQPTLAWPSGPGWSTTPVRVLIDRGFPYVEVAVRVTWPPLCPRKVMIS
jgi:hypothetical protein